MKEIRDSAWAENRERNKKLYPYSFGEPPAISLRWVKWHKPPAVGVLPDGTKLVDQLSMTPHNVGNNERKRTKRASSVEGRLTRRTSSKVERLVEAELKCRSRMVSSLAARELKQSLAQKRHEAREVA